MGNARPDQGAMSLQLLIVPFVVIAFVAIVWRFLPRAEDGSIRLPRLIDESVGMWFVRSALGRETDAPDPDDVIPEPAADEIAYRIGVPGAPAPTVPTRVVVSQGPSKAEPGLLSSPQTAIAPTGPFVPDGSVGRRRTARPSGALAAQRRWAGAVVLAAVAVAVTTLVLASRQHDGEVLSATGTPEGSSGQGFVSGAGGAATDTPAGASDSSSSSGLSPSVEASGPPAATGASGATTPVPAVTPAAARVTPNPTSAPRATARPTATPRASLAPGPTPSAAPTPTAPPTPTPSQSTEPSDTPSP
jgi:hypothetical protein